MLILRQKVGRTRFRLAGVTEYCCRSCYKTGSFEAAQNCRCNLLFYSRYTVEISFIDPLQPVPGASGSLRSKNYRYSILVPNAFKYTKATLGPHHKAAGKLTEQPADGKKKVKEERPKREKAVKQVKKTRGKRDTKIIEGK